MSSVIVWDIETVPDIKGFAANSYDGKGDDEIRAAMGDKFPKHIYHSIILPVLRYRAMVHGVAAPGLSRTEPGQPGSSRQRPLGSGSRVAFLLQLRNAGIEHTVLLF